MILDTKRLIVFALVAVMNLVCFCLMGYDKHCAQKAKRRIPERTLFLSAGLFGALGGVLAMLLFRHKTRHWYFTTFFPLMLVLQAAILVLAVNQGWL